MKVKIGKYKNYIGPYQIAALLKYVGIPEKHYDKIGDWMAGYSKDDKTLKCKDNWFTKFCTWVDKKRKRTVKIKIDPYDTWDMESTLALIILPMLKQLKKEKHGAPYVDDTDVPEYIRSTTAPPKKDEWDLDSFFFKRWDYVMDEMIWTFEQLQPDFDWEAQYFEHPEHDPEKEESFEDSIKNIKMNKEGLAIHQARIDNGLRLFGKYYLALWD